MIKRCVVLLSVIALFLFSGCSYNLNDPFNFYGGPGAPSLPTTGNTQTGRPYSAQATMASPAKNTQLPDENSHTPMPLEDSDVGIVLAPLEESVEVDEATGSIENGLETADKADALPPAPENSQTAENDPGAKTASTKKKQPILDEALVLCELSQEYWQKGELENAIEALDDAYALILDVDTNDTPKLIQQKEDLRFMISKRILEIYASRNIVINGNHNAIPLVMNRHVQREIDLFTKGAEKRFFRESYERSGLYRPRIVKALKEAGLPVELSWLPLIESGFKVNALSRSRALGLWQFIPSTGYKFGLKRDVYIDERLDPKKATLAAIAYLKELHRLFGDWSTVLAAYNCGEGKVLRVIRNQNVKYLDNFWDLYERLPRETARYVPRFLATLHILNNPEKYGLDQVTVYPPLTYETLTVNRPVHLKDVAGNIGTTLIQLKQLNPELRYNILPSEAYELRVPPEKGELLLAKLDEIPKSSRPRPAYIYHRVRPGETLSTIARRYRTSIGRIARANNIRRSNFIVAGKRIKIPQKGTMIARRSIPQRRIDRNATSHRVRRGDSLWNIARRYGTTTKEIQEINSLTNVNLHIGQVLLLPGHKKKLRSMAHGAKIYQVKAGDSPFQIAQDHNMSLGSFLRLNSLSANSRIYPGQELAVE